MLLGWLLPDASYQVLFEDWGRNAYRPRHGRPPLPVRAVQAAGAAFDRARQRYLGASEEEGAAGVLLADPHRGRSIDRTRVS